MTTTWVVVAESSRARIFNLEKLNGPFTEILNFDNPAARKPEPKLESAVHEIVHESHDHGRQDFYEHHEHKPPAERFARKIADLLDSHRLTADYDQLILFAAPSFLGLLREHMTDQTNRRIAFESNKNLVQLRSDKIKEHLPYPFPKIHA